MAVELIEQTDAEILLVRLTGKLSKADYERFLPEIDHLIETSRKLRLLVEMHDFHGWQGGGLWEDVQFDAKHFNDIDRLAVVGEQKWQEGMCLFCGAFTTAEARYFDRAQVDEARKWLQEC